MSVSDRAQAAQRLLDDPMVKDLFALIEGNAIEAMLSAQTDDDRRQGADRVLAVRALRDTLKMMITAQQEATRPAPGIA